MKIYALRTCCGQWAVCSDEGLLLSFESYGEALGTARSAASVINPDVTRSKSLRRVYGNNLRRDTENRAGSFGSGVRPFVPRRRRPVGHVVRAVAVCLFGQVHVARRQPLVLCFSKRAGVRQRARRHVCGFLPVHIRCRHPVQSHHILIPLMQKKPAGICQNNVEVA